MPKVSVLTPIYNTKPAHLRECIKSILNQTFKDFEFLILNDSPDNKEIEKIVLSYKDKRIKYIKNEKNLGISASRNKLLDLASGEYIAVFDHDDISLPQRLEKEVAFLDSNPDFGVVSSWMQFFEDSDFLLKNPETDTKIKIFLTEDCFIAHSACMIRKSILTKNNIRYEELYTPCEDYRLYQRLMSLTKFYNIQEALVKYRFFKDNTSHTQRNKMELMSYLIKLQIRDKFPSYYEEFKKTEKVKSTIFRLRLFGKIPLLKIKNNWVLLFEFIPLFKIMWK